MEQAIPWDDVSVMQEMVLAKAEVRDGPRENGTRKTKVVSCGSSYLDYMFKVMNESHRGFTESFKIRNLLASMQVHVLRRMKHVLHRTRGRSSTTARTSAKKGASSAGGNGGDGGGDGDGPHRTRSKQKNRSSKNRNTPLKHPPRTSSGAIANNSLSQSPPPSDSQGLVLLALLYVIHCILIIVLLAMGERDLAYIGLGSASIPALLNHLKDKPDKKD